MNELIIFNNPKFGNIRTITENGKTLFCGADVAKALGYKKPQNAITAHCKGALKRGIPHPQSPDKTIEMLFILQGDIYRLAAKSELPGAEEFESWIFDEVLPSIHEHGAYMTPDTIEKLISNPDTIIQIATALKEEQSKRKALETRAEADRPKVLFADSVAASKSSILVGEMAKLLKQNGVHTGQNRLFETLREKGFSYQAAGIGLQHAHAESYGDGPVRDQGDGHQPFGRTYQREQDPESHRKGPAIFCEYVFGPVTCHSRTTTGLSNNWPLKNFLKTS